MHVRADASVRSFFCIIAERDLGRRVLEDERLNRARRALDLRGLAVPPEVVRDLLLAAVHDDRRDLAVGVHEGRGEERAAAGRTRHASRAGAYELREVADVVEGVRVDEAAAARVGVGGRAAEVLDVEIGRGLWGERG